MFIALSPPGMQIEVVQESQITPIAENTAVGEDIKVVERHEPIQDLLIRKTNSPWRWTSLFPYANEMLT